MNSIIWRAMASGSLVLGLGAQAAPAAHPWCDPWRTAADSTSVGDASNHIEASPSSQPKADIVDHAGRSADNDDPLRIFLSVVDRYRRLYTYRDTVNMVQVTTRAGEEPTRIETRIACEVAGSQLRVTTPASQLRSAAGLGAAAAKSQADQQREQDYALWLAPHMKMKFADKPLRDFRAGVQEGFTATEAERVTIDDKPMVHVELRSGDGQSENCLAEFDLYIDSQSMLIERIEGRQIMPDGAQVQTTLEIDPDEQSISDVEGQPNEPPQPAVEVDGPTAEPPVS